jgi:hypothetical protein
MVFAVRLPTVIEAVLPETVMVPPRLVIAVGVRPY